MEEIRSWAGLAAVLISVGTVIWNWLTSGGTKALAEVATLKKEISAKLTEVEQEVEAKLDALERDHRILAEAVNNRFNMQDLQMARMEEAMKHLPDRNQVSELALAIEKMSGLIGSMDARLSGRIETLDERLRPVAAISDRLQEFLLEQAARK